LAKPWPWAIFLSSVVFLDFVLHCFVFSIVEVFIILF
jgi:hypothetical protein